MVPQESEPKHTQIIIFNFNRHIHMIMHLTICTYPSSNQIKGISFLLFRRLCCPAQSNKATTTSKEKKKVAKKKKKNNNNNNNNDNNDNNNNSDFFFKIFYYYSSAVVLRASLMRFRCNETGKNTSKQASPKYQRDLDKDLQKNQH